MKITANDFDNLIINSTNWRSSASAWREQEGRFEDADFSEPEREIDYEFARAYWVKNYPAVMFIKAFLQAFDFTYRVYYDSADDAYMITTNYGWVI